jgi:UDP-N-acetylglucosamine 4,6-dehydratase
VLPITDERMTRFWITLDQGVKFVLDSLERMEGGEIFIPKIPSMGIMDVAQVVAPECSTKIIGIRPGEKLHEIMITEDDAINTAEFNDHYVIQPASDWWDAKAYLERKGGKKVPEQFSYSSDNNTVWMSQQDLIDLLGKEKIEI